MSEENIQAELDHMRRQIVRQRRDISDLDAAGIDTTSAVALLARMTDKVADLTARHKEEIWNDRPKYRGSTKWIRGTQRTRA